MAEIPFATDLDGFPIQAMTTQRLDEIRASYRFSNGSRPWTADDVMDAFEAVDDLVIEVDRLLAVEAAFRETLKPDVAFEPCHRSLLHFEHGRTAVPLSTLADVTLAKRQAVAERDAALIEVERLRAQLALELDELTSLEGRTDA
jgi:hypothetical protein